MEYVVRLYDHFDGWIDVYGPATEEFCIRYFNKQTLKGTKMVDFSDKRGYYKIFPANTRMLQTPESLGR